MAFECKWRTRMNTEILTTTPVVLSRHGHLVTSSTDHSEMTGHLLAWRRGCDGEELTTRNSLQLWSVRMAEIIGRIWRCARTKNARDTFTNCQVQLKAGTQASAATIWQNNSNCMYTWISSARWFVKLGKRQVATGGLPRVTRRSNLRIVCLYMDHQCSTKLHNVTYTATNQRWQLQSVQSQFNCRWYIA